MAVITRHFAKMLLRISMYGKFEKPMQVIKNKALNLTLIFYLFTSIVIREIISYKINIFRQKFFIFLDILGIMPMVIIDYNDNC